MDLDLDFLKSLISDFDLMALLPDLADVMDGIVKILNWALVVGPLVLVVMGLWYLILPPKEANHFLGYRFFWGMGSVKSWKFTQRFAGAVWAIVGAVLAFRAYSGWGELAEMETLDMLYRAVEVLLNQIVVVVVTCLCINVIVFILFDFKGNIRKVWVKLAAWISAKIEQSRANKPPKEKKVRNTNSRQ